MVIVLLIFNCVHIRLVRIHRVLVPAISITYKRQRVLLRPEQIARLAVHRHAAGRLIVLDRTHEELVLAQQVREQHTEDHRADAAAHKALPRLLRTQLDQRRAPEEEAKHVRHHVVAHDHRHRHNAPDQALEDVLDDQVALRDDDQQGDVRPGEQAELLHVVLLHQRQHEPHEANAVQRERQKAMVGDEEAQILQPIDHHAKVVDQILAVEEVVRGEQKVPREAAEPGQTVDAVHLVANRDDLLEAFHLDEQRLYWIGKPFISNELRVRCIKPSTLSIFTSGQRAAKQPPRLIQFITHSLMAHVARITGNGDTDTTTGNTINAYRPHAQMEILSCVHFVLFFCGVSD